MKVKVEKEFAIIIRGCFDIADFEAIRKKAFSAEHAVFLAKKDGFNNIAQALNVDGPFYKRFIQENNHAA